MQTKRSAVGATAPWKEVIVDGVRLAYDDEGAGPVLICLHAIGHGARDFADLRGRLADRYRVIAVDWPGQGNSGDDHVPASARRYAELLAAFVDDLELGDVVILGNSIGGGAAIRFAAEHPQKVRALVLADSAGLVGIDRTVRFFTGMMTRFFRAGTRGAWWFPRLFRAYYRRVLTQTPARAQRERLIASADEIAPILVQAWQSFGAPEADLRLLAAGLECPVLVTWATKDLVIPLARTRPAIERIPHARLQTFAAGHAAFLECPEEFRVCLEEFLEQTCRAAPALRGVVAFGRPGDAASA